MMIGPPFLGGDGVRLPSLLLVLREQEGPRRNYLSSFIHSSFLSLPLLTPYSSGLHSFKEVSRRKYHFKAGGGGYLAYPHARKGLTEVTRGP